MATGATARRAVTAAEEYPTHQRLELEAAAALAARDFAQAFALADRRCRIRPPPEAHAYLLRAEASWRMGEKEAALGDLDLALTVAPDDVATNRRILAWSTGAPRERAAKTLLVVESDFPVLRRAIETLRLSGRREFGAIAITDDEVRGWAVWEGGGIAELSVVGRRHSALTTLRGDSHHPLSFDGGQATSFAVRRPRSPDPQSIFLSVDGRVFHSAHAAENEAAPLVSQAVRDRDGAVTVIVPVHDDFEATRACLDLLLAELDRNPRHRAIIVDDASPDIRIPPYLDGLAAHPAVTLMVNPRNLGFVGSVNRALEAATGDVLLLNADTVPPPRFIDRLSAAAASRPDIGLVVPLSNNAELTSFPLANAGNPLGGYEDVLAIDVIAAKANSGATVDIPSGTGFCLYITAECRRATGRLSARFDRGYFEDTDLCLRARAHGLRTVCDPSVYVGHAGSRSFAGDKTLLATRNLTVLRDGFPDYLAEHAAFIAADPLARHRAAIERTALATGEATVLVAAERMLLPIAEARADVLAAEGNRVVIAECAGSRVRLRGHAGAIPQSLTCDLGEAAGRAAFAGIATGLSTRAGEIVDAGAGGVARALEGLSIPYDLLLGDADGWTAPESAPIADHARRVLAGGEMSLAWARHSLPRQVARLAAIAGRSVATGEPGTAPLARGAGLGVVTLAGDDRESGYLAAFLGRLCRLRPDLPMVVLGHVVDDQALMALGNVEVTGPIGAAELPRLVRQYGIGTLFLGFGRPLFGHPVKTRAEMLGLPTASIDWSFGTRPPNPGDLAIPPDEDAATAAGQVAAFAGPAEAVNRPAPSRSRASAPGRGSPRRSGR